MDEADNLQSGAIQHTPASLNPQSTISTKLFIALGFIAVTTIFAGTVAIVALKRFEGNFANLINSSLPTLADTAHISQLAATVADRGPSLIISPNTWTRLTIVGQADDDAKWLEEVLNRIPKNELSKNRKSELLDLKTTLVKAYNTLNTLTESRITYTDRLNVIQQNMVQIQKDLISAQTRISFAKTNARQSIALFHWYEAVHNIIFKLMNALDLKHPAPLQRLQANINIDIDNIYKQTSTLPQSLQHQATARMAKLSAITLGPDGLFNIKMKDLTAISQVRATLTNSRSLAERFIVASQLATLDVQNSIRDTNQETSRAMDITLKAMVGFILISAFIAVLTFLYVSRTVLQRLSSLRESMLAHADGLDGTIDTSGNDEITDMARSLQYLVDTLHLRETSLFEAKEEAEQASVAKTRFLAAASHDLRQPLQALNLFIYALENQEQDPAKRDIIELIRNSLDSLKELLNTLLDVSKLEAGVVQPYMRGFRAVDVINSIKDEMTAVAWAKDIDLRIVPSRVYIYSDLSLLRTVIRNLLDNAIKYTDNGKVLIGCCKRGMNLRFDVLDTGPGIPADQLELIFQDFYQIDNEARKRTQGLGLGLSIVKRMADLLGCSVGCRSVLGKGSLFWVDVPMMSAPAHRMDINSEALNHPTNVVQGHAHIVVFEDDEHVLTGLKSVLEGHGFTTTCFQSVDHEKIKDAFADQECRPDLIIADYRLEGNITGRAAIAIIQSIVGENIPAIIITGDTAPERLREARESGFPILHKPVRPERLIDMVNQKLSETASSTEVPVL